MKKKLNSIVALLFIVFTMFAGGAKAFGANNALRPDINGEGTLTIHKHWAEDGSQIGNEGTGGLQEVSNPAVAGVKFKIYQLTPVGVNTPETPPSEKDGAVYVANDMKTELTVTFKSNTYKYTMGTAQEGETNGTGVYKFTGLEGFYYVEEDLASSSPTVNGETVKITSPAKPFIVSVPMTNSDGNGWFKDVHVYPKNQGMTPEKTVNNGNSNSVNIGDELEFGIKVAIPSDIGDSEYKVFNINDTLDPALTYTADSTKVYVYKDNGSGGWDRVEIPATASGKTNYVIDYSAPPKLSVIFSADGRKALADAMAGSGKYTHVGIEFKAIVNENVLSMSESNYTVKNQGEIEWNNTPGDETEKTPTTVTETNTGDIEIDKKDQEGDPLEDTEFQIAKDKAAAEAGEYIKVKVKEVEGVTVITDLVYPNDTDDYATALNWVIRPHATAGLGVSEDGKTFYADKFQGLQTHTGMDNTKVGVEYFVVETKAPSGFNLLDEPVGIKFADNETTHIISKEIVNSQGFKLPNTGSIGMILLTILGIVLIGLAILMFLPKKRRS